MHPRRIAEQRALTSAAFFLIEMQPVILSFSQVCVLVFLSCQYITFSHASCFQGGLQTARGADEY